MARRKSKVKLPEWAQSLWEDLGSPKLDDIQSVAHGDLLERRHGLRRDDLVELLMDIRALRDEDDAWIRGRLVLVAHTRPAYIDDSELMAFEREDQKRRSNIHEKVEKKTKGNDDAHLWG
jgi:hypothetical protein